MYGQLKNIDPKELKLPETVFIHNIESRVFQAIVVQCLSRIEGIALVEGNIIDYLLGRNPLEHLSGITVEQDEKNHAVRIKVEVHIAYGISIPQKAEEIQTKVAEEVSQHTGLHVGSVHVIFKDLIGRAAQVAPASPVKTEYSDEF